MRLINSSFYCHHQHHSSNLLHLYLHPCLLLHSLSLSFFLFSSPLFFFFNCHCCRVRALGFPPSISQDRAAITAQEKRRRPAVRRGGKGAEEGERGERPLKVRCGTPHYCNIPAQRVRPPACTSQGHCDQTGIIRNNAPCYDLPLLSEHK